MSCNCSGGCQCAPQAPVQAPLRQIPAPLPEISFTYTVGPAGSDPVVTISGVPPIYNVQVQFPAAASPVFASNVIVNMIPNGDPATGTIDNTDPLNPILTLNLPSPLDGQDGVSPFTELAVSFIQPAAGSTVTLTGVDVSWMSLGSWIYVEGGGHYVAASNPLSATQILVRNPGAADLSPFGWTATSIPGNAAPGATITPSGFSTQVQPSGPPGYAGENGTPGPAMQGSIVYVVPVSAPVSDELATVFYFNAAPPNVATVARVYTWDGAAWIAGPNYAGPGGVQVFSGSADPNVTPPGTANIGDLYFRESGSALTIYQKATVSTWNIIAGPYALSGTGTNNIDHTSAPGPVTIDTAYFSTFITANKDINLGGLDHDDTNYAGQGNWTVQVLNTDGSAIDIEFAIGRWEQDPALTIPDTIAAGGSFFITFVRNMDTGMYVILHAFTSSVAGS